MTCAPQESIARSRNPNDLGGGAIFCAPGTVIQVLYVSIRIDTEGPDALQ
jgi:hypothetical protein